MEIRKGENMMEHEDEIYSRPARTWFQSEKDKKKAQGAIRSSAPVLRTENCTEVSKTQYEAGFDIAKKSKSKQLSEETKVLSLAFDFKHEIFTCRAAEAR